MPSQSFPSRRSRFVNPSSPGSDPDPNQQESVEVGQNPDSVSKAPKDLQPWLKLAGMGMELAGSTLGVAAVGYLIDGYRGKADGYGIAAGAFIGFAFGMFRFIQKAMQQIQK
jgi:F0F1-type ATP synthase assembly protein I